MNKIIKLKQAISISKQLRKENKSVVICGGCFDVLHVGHIRFLKKAKAKGDTLFLLLENDKNVKKLKGKNRPINSQTERAEILSSISYIDYIIMLNEMKNNDDYDNLIYSLKPNIIAVTQNSPQKLHNQRQAKMVNAKVISVIERISNKSTTEIASIINNTF